MRRPLAVALVLLSGPAVARTEPAPVAEARVFMAEYARDLNARNRDAVVARYHSGGAQVAGYGRSRFASREEIAQDYAEWTGPHAFGWRDLRFEALGPDAVAVTGLFDWTQAAGETAATYSYTAVLTRDGDRLKIRVEDESGACPKAP